MSSASLRHNLLGRLYETAGPSGTVPFLDDGDALVGEYDGSGNLLRRYVQGGDAKADDPIAWYEGPRFAAANERLMPPDRHGLIAIVTDITGSTEPPRPDRAEGLVP